MSMPGMMDTVLNVGLNDVVVEGLAKQVNDRFAWDCYRRLLQVRAQFICDRVRFNEV
jgi:pyruvate,orthophosphate dikinase